MEESVEMQGGITISELKKFLNGLPEKFDNCVLINGEVADIEGEFYVRIDKPVVHLEIDGATNEFLLLHQTSEELDEINKKINGDTKTT